MTEQFSVSNRTVLVTGAGGGIGSAIVNAFRSGGANVLATDANLETLRSTLASLPHGNGVLPMAMDVASEDDVNRVLDAVAKHFGRLDVLVNNAGVKSAQPLLNGDADKIERTIQINSVAVLRCSKLAIERFMKDKGAGSSISDPRYRPKVQSLTTRRAAPTIVCRKQLFTTSPSCSPMNVPHTRSM